MKKTTLLFLFGCLVWFSGCRLQPQPAPSRTQFLLDTGFANAADVPHLPSCLRLRSVSAQPPFTGIALVYRTGTVTFEKDFFNQFLIAPDQQMDAAMDQWLRAAGALPCGDEQNSGDIRLTLEPHLEALYADFQSSAEPFAVARLRFVLTEYDRSCRCGRIIMDQTVEATTPLPPGPTAETVVMGMSAAVKDCLLQAMVQLQQAM